MLQSDVTIKGKYGYYYAGKDVNLFVNRIPFENEVTTMSWTDKEVLECWAYLFNGPTAVQ